MHRGLGARQSDLLTYVPMYMYTCPSDGSMRKGQVKLSGPEEGEEPSPWPLGGQRPGLQRTNFPEPE